VPIGRYRLLLISNGPTLALAGRDARILCGEGMGLYQRDARLVRFRILSSHLCSQARRRATQDGVASHGSHGSNCLLDRDG